MVRLVFRPGRFIRIENVNHTQLYVSPHRPWNHSLAIHGKDALVTTMTPVTEPNTLQEYIEAVTKAPMKQLTIRCRIKYYVTDPRVNFTGKATAQTPSLRRRRSAETYHVLLYDSTKDMDTVTTNNLLVSVTYAVEEGAQASLAWIAAVVIGIIVVIIVVALSIWLCTRDKGETYPLYAKECEQGNDPLQELKEKETFHTYERMDEAPVPANQCMLNDDSLYVGSDDDGELEDYAMDAGNFNEEASFIGQYSAPGNKTVNGGLDSRSRTSDHRTAV